MYIKEKYKSTILFLIFAFSFIAAITLLPAADKSVKYLFKIPDSASSKEFIGYVLNSCRSTVVQASLIFVSMFCIFKIPVCIPVFALRGVALGSALRSADYSSPFVISSVISYSFITILFVAFAHTMFTRQFDKEEKMTKRLPAYLYSFLMINGAAILIRVVPQLIISNFFVR